MTDPKPVPRHDCKTEDRKLPIDRPCSACGAGDYEMEHHSHCPPFREPVVPDPPSQTLERAEMVRQVKQWLKDKNIALEYYGGEHCASDLIVTYLLSGARSSPPESTGPLVTRFSEFDDDAHPFHKWWQEHGQFMLSGGGRRESIWAARGWIAREQLLCGVDVTGDSMHERAATGIKSKEGQDVMEPSVTVDDRVRDGGVFLGSNRAGVDTAKGELGGALSRRNYQGAARKS